MARNQKTKTSSNQETKTSATTLRLDDEWMMYLNIRAMSKGSSMSAFIQALLANDLSNLSRAESEPLRQIVKSATGKTLRIDRNSTDSKTDDTVSGEEQGLTTSPVLRRINRIQDHAVDQPIVAALDSMYRDQ